jgi:membrane protein YqaA with SNARE-associated domain
MVELLGPLVSLFVASFVAATLFPLPSEAALFAYLQLHPERAAAALAVATLGNTAGGMTSYLVGRLLPPRKLSLRAIEWLRRYGSPLTVLAWLPLVGDALSVGAGWLRMNWMLVLGFMLAGRLARYVVVAALS